ncbi:MAG TPA: VOC family protein [Xanthobacteraceae bacterium]|nr:VOC family protein [Xanthobacteraceae bacterium]
MSSFERLIPVLVYRYIAAAHDFLVQAFGFESGGVERDAAGKAVHGEVRVGSTAVWLHRMTADLAGSGLVVHVSDVDAHFARARAAGARIQYEPTDQPYGQREYEARDPEGHRWWFATPLPASTMSSRAV